MPKTVSDKTDLTSSGRLFQSYGAAAENEQLPMSHKGQMTRNLEVDN